MQTIERTWVTKWSVLFCFLHDLVESFLAVLCLLVAKYAHRPIQALLDMTKTTANTIWQDKDISANVGASNCCTNRTREGEHANLKPLT